MKLWLLRPIDPNAPGDNPWRPWYDKLFGVVVRADTKQKARMEAAKTAGEERFYPWTDPGRGGLPRRRNPWRDPKLSSCVELTVDGPVAVIIKDFHSA